MLILVYIYMYMSHIILTVYSLFDTLNHVKREMTRDACNAQKFVQNISLTIAWKPPYPRSDINRRRIKLEEAL